MKPPIRWGLLSTANINRRLIPAIHASERGKLTAVASRNKQTAEAYARKWVIPVSFGSYEAMLASDQVDAVYISLPNHLHAEWSIRALEAGKHVLCEKPLALTVEEVDQMIDASRAAHCVLAEAFMYRHHPQTKLAGEIVHSGKIGEVLKAIMFILIAPIELPQVDVISFNRVDDPIQPDRAARRQIVEAPQ